MRVLVATERDGDGGYAKNDGFAGGGDGAGVEHADAGVGAQINAADHQVRLRVFVEQSER